MSELYSRQQRSGTRSSSPASVSVVGQVEAWKSLKWRVTRRLTWAPGTDSAHLVSAARASSTLVSRAKTSPCSSETRALSLWDVALSSQRPYRPSWMWSWLAFQNFDHMYRCPSDSLARPSSSNYQLPIGHALIICRMSRKPAPEASWLRILYWQTRQKLSSMRHRLCFSTLMMIWHH